ncbi:MAG: PKD domain-containing protein, partial [Methanomicrobia archaeon]|nr:PKD domain-containing protein [Methanomicrobia archaeon]
MNDNLREVTFASAIQRRARKHKEAKGIGLAALALLAVFVIALPSAAAQINIDGKGDDWIGVPDIITRTDSIMELTVEQFTEGGGYCNAYQLNWSSGYDLADLQLVYNSTMDTLYIKFNLSGVPGDADGDYNPDTCTNCNLTYNCSTGNWSDRPRATSDDPGVGFGGEYFVELDVDSDAQNDYRITYTQNSVEVRVIPGYSDVTGDFTCAGSIGTGPWSIANVTNVVELSVYPMHNMTGFGKCNDFTMGIAKIGTTNDFIGEDSVSGLIINAAPNAVAIGDDVCLCNNITFYGTSSVDPDGVIANYTWDFDDGNVSYGNITEHHYAETGTYTVTLTVTDDDGFVCNDTTTVTVFENPVANFTVDNICFCTGDVVFTNASTNGTAPYNLSWDFENDGDIDGYGESFTLTHPTPGVYWMNLTVRDANNCTDW